MTSRARFLSLTVTLALLTACVNNSETTAEPFTARLELLAEQVPIEELPEQFTIDILLKILVTDGEVDSDESDLLVIASEEGYDFPAVITAPLTGTGWREGDDKIVLELAAVLTEEDETAEADADCLATIGSEQAVCDLTINGYDLPDIVFYNTYGSIRLVE